MMVGRMLVLLVMGWSVVASAQETAVRELGMPPSFRDLSFGMSLEDFSGARSLEALQVEQTFSFRITVTHPHPAPGVSEVTYYFDAEGHRPLYELILEFEEGVRGEAVARRLYGVPEPDGVWRGVSPEGDALEAWAFDNRLVVIARLPGTEWEE